MKKKNFFCRRCFVPLRVPVCTLTDDRRMYKLSSRAATPRVSLRGYRVAVDENPIYQLLIITYSAVL